MIKSFCKGCGLEIGWIKTVSGKSMPCNLPAVKYWESEKAPGKVVTPDGRVVSCYFDGPPGKATGKGFVSHFATCPAARKFRR